MAVIDELIAFFQGARPKWKVSSKTDTLVQGYNDVFDKLLQEFCDWAAGDTLVVVHRFLEDLTPMVVDLRGSFSKDLLSNLPDI